MIQEPSAAAPLRVDVFLASPGDVSDERALALRVLERLPYDTFLRGRISVESVAWDKPGADTPMLATMTPQEAIEAHRRKPSQCDIVIVIFWSRREPLHRFGRRLEAGAGAARPGGARGGRAAASRPRRPGRADRAAAGGGACLGRGAAVHRPARGAVHPGRPQVPRRLRRVARGRRRAAGAAHGGDAARGLLPPLHRAAGTGRAPACRHLPTWRRPAWGRCTR
jgi:hypothetical protein